MQTACFFLSDTNQTTILSTDSLEIVRRNFIETSVVGTKLFHADGEVDR